MRNCLEKGSGAELKAKDKRFVLSVIDCCHYHLELFVFQKLNHENLHFEKLNYEYVLQKG